MRCPRLICFLLGLGIIALASGSSLPSFHGHDHSITHDCGICHPQTHAPALLLATDKIDPLLTNLTFDVPECSRFTKARSLETAGERAPPTLS